VSHDEQREAAHQAVSNLVAQIDPGAMVNRFVLLCEVMDSQGERAVWTLAPKDAQAWDTLGLLDFARSLEYAATPRVDE